MAATSLERVRLSDEITELGQTVFRQCKKLPEITLPKNLTTIGKAPFSAVTASRGWKSPTAHSESAPTRFPTAPT
ncbi:MAG: leucine-rich repeat protein [Ruminococcus callidus]